MRLMAAALLLAGCDALLVEKTTFCPDTGAVCPQGLACAKGPILCGEPADVSVCKAVDELGECSSAASPHGYCSSGICTPCSTDYSWCHYPGWSQMTPLGIDLQAIWVAASDDAYAVGDAGAVLHYDGTQWQQVATISTTRLSKIWGTSGNDLFVVDNGTIRHFDGTSWTATPLSPHPQAVWGSAPDDVFAVGTFGSIFHYDGTTWSAQTSNTPKLLAGVWGTSSSDVFAAGLETVMHYDGSTWSTSLSDAVGTYDAVWGSGPNDVFVAGQCVTCTGTVIRHYNGSWEAPVVLSNQPNQTVTNLTGVWTAPGASALVTSTDGTIYRLTGGTWTSEGIANIHELDAIQGTSVDNVFAVGLQGTIWHYDGPM